MKYDSSFDSRLMVRKMEFAEGRAKGVQFYQVRNQVGLQFDVLIERGMGIGDLLIDGERISFASETGPVHPMYYSADSDQWLRTFGGGFLATCGLNQTGEPCTDQGERLGLHGRIDNTPAEYVGSRVFEKDGVLWGEIFGTVRQVKHQGEYLELQRTIRLRSDEKKIWLWDTVTNRGSRQEPYMILYHINFGFPFLCPGAEIQMDTATTEGWDEASVKRGDLWHEMPDIGEAPQEYLWEHRLRDGAAGQVTVSGARHRVRILYPTRELPLLGQWQMAKENQYVMAIEPTNAHLRGRAWERQNGMLHVLQPKEQRQIQMTFLFDD